MSADSKPFANSHQQMLAARVDWEVHQMIIPHLEGKANHGYPFSSEDEMLGTFFIERIGVELGLGRLAEAAGKMPPECRDTFHYIALREINAVVQAFVEVAERRSQSVNRTPVVAG